MGCISYFQDAQEFSDVERAIETLIKNFHNYSVEGKKETLTPAELRDLVTQQLPHLMPVLRGWTLPSPPSIPVTSQASALPSFPPLWTPGRLLSYYLPLARVGQEDLEVLPC